MRELLAKRLTEPCRPELTACCPSMDLIATVTRRCAVDVWRINGQRVFGLAPDEADDNAIEGLAWKNDGHMLAVALSSGTILLIDSFSGKTAHQLRITSSAPVCLPNWSSSQQSTADTSATAVTRSTLSWSSHFANARSTRLDLQDAGPDLALDDLLAHNADVAKLLKTKANLPRHFAKIDIETSLPKLSTLPATGADDDVFSTRNSIDSIFHTQSSTGQQQKASGDTVGALLGSAKGCNLHIRIFDSFEIGTVEVSQGLPKGLKGRRIVQQASHPLLSTHYLVLEAEADGSSSRSATQGKLGVSLHLVGLDLRFIPQTSYNLPLVATKATQLQNLLRYISQIQTQLSQEVRTAFDLPSRFLRNVNESLAEQDSSASFTTAALHLVLTGQCDARLKEWLVDEVGERGLKRWEKAVADCLDLIRRMMSECLLPAIERTQVVISRLNGLSRFSDTANKLGLDERSVRAVRDVLDVLTILCEDLLRDVCVEIREFAAFMRWIKWEAEVEAFEEGSERAEEMRESYNGEAELRTVLDYISGAMQTSRVVGYIDIAKDAASQEIADNGEPQLYDNYKKARRGEAKEELPKLGDLVRKLQVRSETVFKGIADTLRKNVLTSYIGELAGDIDSAVMDCRILESSPPADEYEVCIAAKAKSSREDGIVMFAATGDFRQGAKIAGLQKRKVRVEGEILDVKIDADGLLVLVESGADRQLLWQAIGGDDGESRAWETRYHFPAGLMTGGLRPARLQVNGRRGRRNVTVLDEAGMGFVVLSLDSW